MNSDAAANQVLYYDDDHNTHNDHELAKIARERVDEVANSRSVFFNAFTQVNDNDDG